MSKIKPSELDIDLICERFPKQFDLLNRLVQSNQDFGSLCEEYCIAYKTMRRMESKTTENWKAELAEYRELIQELGAEIAGMLLQAGRFSDAARLKPGQIYRE